MEDFNPDLLPIGKPENIKHFFTYSYQFIDNLSFIIPAETYLREHNLPESDKYIEEVKRLFVEHGWEGDGELGIIWLPPFIGLDEDTSGFCLWHVKQSNNGTSWIASPKKLPFDAFQNQNNADSTLEGFTKPESIIQGDIDRFVSLLKTTNISFVNQIKMLQESENNKSICIDILNNLYGFNQNQLIGWFNDFINYCYLRFLIEGISHGNKAIKLRKINVSADPGSYLPEDYEDIGEEGKYWLTIQAMISDIWRAYKFLPFKDKFENLIKAVDYKANADNRDMIFKHVVIRNCIQHHDWQLEKISLESLGRDNIEIVSPSKSIVVKAWQKIPLTFEENIKILEALENFSSDFGKHVDKVITTRVFTR